MPGVGDRLSISAKRDLIPRFIAGGACAGLGSDSCQRKVRERARLAGSEGLSLTDPVVNHRLPAARVAAAVQELRLTLMKEALTQAKDFSQASGLNWQLADIEFGVNSLQPEFRNAQGAYREEMDDLDGGEAAERIRLVAAVILKAAPAGG